MSKDAYYFSHDSNAKDDPKCMMLIEQLGPEGYGIFWILVEILRDQPEYKYPLGLIPAIARRFNTSTEKVKIVINGFQLFKFDELYFWSESLIRRMEKREHFREIAVEAGRVSAEKRRFLASNRLLLTDGSTDVQRTFNDGSTDVQLRKERKGKEIKGNIEKVNKEKNAYGSFNNVFLTLSEYNTLKEKFNNHLMELIDELSEAIASKGYRYKSHYATILNWSRRNEKEARNGTAGQNSSKLPPRNGYTEPPPDPRLTGDKAIG